MSEKSEANDKPERGLASLDDVKQAAEDLLGAGDMINVKMMAWGSLDDGQFNMARSMAQNIHKEQAESGMSNGAGQEVVAILLALELLSMHAQGVSMGARQMCVQSILGKALLHAKTFAEQLDSGNLKPVRVYRH